MKSYQFANLCLVIKCKVALGVTINLSQLMHSGDPEDGLQSQSSHYSLIFDT